MEEAAFLWFLVYVEVDYENSGVSIEKGCFSIFVYV